MHSRFLMVSSAVFTGIVGLAASFLAEEWLGFLGTPARPGTVLTVQVGGAAYLGFAMLNWMGRGNLVGGIYGRPVALANFLHFAVVAIVLLKLVFDEDAKGMILGAILPYGLFAMWYGLVLFASPRPSGRHGR